MRITTSSFEIHLTQQKASCINRKTSHKTGPLSKSSCLVGNIKSTALAKRQAKKSHFKLALFATKCLHFFLVSTSLLRWLSTWNSCPNYCRRNRARNSPSECKPKLVISLQPELQISKVILSAMHLPIISILHEPYFEPFLQDLLWEKPSWNWPI